MHLFLPAFDRLREIQAWSAFLFGRFTFGKVTPSKRERKLRRLLVRTRHSYDFGTTFGQKVCGADSETRNQERVQYTIIVCVRLTRDFHIV